MCCLTRFSRSKALEANIGDDARQQAPPSELFLISEGGIYAVGVLAACDLWRLLECHRTSFLPKEQKRIFIYE